MVNITLVKLICETVVFLTLIVLAAYFLAQKDIDPKTRDTWGYILMFMVGLHIDSNWAKAVKRIVSRQDVDTIQINESTQIVTK